MPATFRSTSSSWKTLRGKTTSNNLRTCETVSAGAFFFQPHLEMPEKEMGQHTREHVMVPARGFADLGIRLRRDNWVSVRYAEELNSGKSSVLLQRADRHG